MNNQNSKDEGGRQSAVNAVVMLLVEHKKKLLIMGILLAVAFLIYLVGDTASSDKLDVFLNTSLIEMNIGQLLLVLIFWSFLRD